MRRLLTVAIVGAFVAALAVHEAGAVRQDLAQADWDEHIERAETGDPVGPHGIMTRGIRTVSAGEEFRAGGVKEYFLGDEYRDVWSIPIEVPVLDFVRTAGGLTPTGAAGGMQSSLLFLDGADGRQFVLRKLEKRAGDALPRGTQRTIVEDIAQDQISSMNPYAAFVIAPMAQAAGILHTEPQLVYIPDDPRLAEYRDDFADELGLLERNVTGDVSDADRFARSTEVLDFEDLLDRVWGDAEARVDQEAYVRARLFDMLIGDRDRHDEQWFWAAAGDGRRFVPIPIDRDFAFARFDGVLNQVGRFSGTTDLRKQTYFDERIQNLVGLNHQGAKLDILFTSELDRADWSRIAAQLEHVLTDEVIEEAIRGWPQPVFDRIGEETIATLKSRRDDLPRAADEYYELLMQKVDVVGSNEAERFIINRLDEDRTEVVIEHQGRELYRRLFLSGETDELRLYGLGGNDEFVLEGAAREGVLILAVGGDGDDLVVSGDGRRANDFRFYDREINRVTRENARDVKLLRDPTENGYELHRYEFDRSGPAFSFDYDSGEGIYIGGGIKMTRYGFLREPYAARHRIVANYAPRSHGYNIHYDGRINEFAGEWDANIEADLLDFDRFDDFYGFGNETPANAADQFVAHFRWIRAYPAALRKIGPLVTFRIGPYFEYADIEPPSGVSEEDPVSSGYTAEQLTDKYVGGVLSRFEVDGRDTSAAMQSGLQFITEAGVHMGLRHSDSRFARIASELRYYLNPLRPITFAFRVGGATNIGDFTFYQANAVGGRENVRGLPRTRFSGRTSAYGNSEVRLKLTDFNIYLTRGELGTFGFYDIGRVWVDGEDSRRWHQGYGAGLWVTPFYQIILSGSVGFSNEDTVFTVSTGMFF